MVSEITLRRWKRLKYMPPAPFLAWLSDFYAQNPMHILPPEIANLRRRDVNPIGQAKKVAAFCYGVSQLLGVEITYADDEAQDYDYVGHYVREDVHHFVPIQLKEFVPASLPSATTLQAEIDKLKKYGDADNLIIAMHINRTAQVRLSELDFSGVRAKELWFFGATQAESKDWIVVGNVLSPRATWHEFRLP